jgi:hypothetical protein
MVIFINFGWEMNRVVVVRTPPAFFFQATSESLIPHLATNCTPQH